MDRFSHALILIVTLSYLASVVDTCVNDAQCINSCPTAERLEKNCAIKCNRMFARCTCDGVAALRRNGSCAEVVSLSGSCAPTHDVLFYLSAAPSPELTPQDINAGTLSAQFHTILQSAMGSALNANPQEVAISGAHLVAESVFAASAVTLFFDLSFSFCMLRTQHPHLPVSLSELELEFILELQRFTAFQTSAGRLISLTPLAISANSTTTSTTLMSILTIDQPTDDQSASWETIFMVSCIIFVVIALALIAIGTTIHLRARKQSQTQIIHVPIEDSLSNTNGSPEPCIFASVAVAFHPGDVEDAKAFRESCLELQEREIVEVIAGGHGWLYGRVTPAEGASGAEIRTGYFPENRISWYGRIVQHQKDAGLDANWLVAACHDFSNSDVDDNIDWRSSCLSLQEGEVVEVLASGGGWLYGRVAGSEPERLGYFPENRAVWLNSDNGEAGEEADTFQEQMVARVGSSFSPGIPGEPEEQAAEDFWESCIALAPGDVVEVIAAAGGWLYGRVVGAPDRLGFFPENRISWIGQPVAQEGVEDSSSQLHEDALRLSGNASSDGTVIGGMVIGCPDNA